MTSTLHMSGQYASLHAGCQQQERQREGQRASMLHGISGHPKVLQSRSTRPQVRSFIPDC